MSCGSLSSAGVILAQPFDILLLTLVPYRFWRHNTQRFGHFVLSTPRININIIWEALIKKERHVPQIPVTNNAEVRENSAGVIQKKEVRQRQRELSLRVGYSVQCHNNCEFNLCAG